MHQTIKFFDQSNTLTSRSEIVDNQCIVQGRNDVRHGKLFLLIRVPGALVVVERLFRLLFRGLRDIATKKNKQTFVVAHVNAVRRTITITYAAFS